MKTVCISGLGLMGGKCCRLEVLVHHRRPEVSTAAAARGWGEVIDDPRDAFDHCDCMVIGTPVSVTALILQWTAGRNTDKLPVITDVGSTKASICQDLTLMCESGAFIGSHPMCGSHLSGLEHADPQLYQAATVVLCPHPNCNSERQTPCANYGQTLAANSPPCRQLPMTMQLLKQVIFPTSIAVTAHGLSDDALPLAATGFRDTSRVAAGSVPLWTDILQDNRSAVLAALQDCLAQLQRALEDNDAEAINWLEQGKERRQMFDRAQNT